MLVKQVELLDGLAVVVRVSALAHALASLRDARPADARRPSLVSSEGYPPTPQSCSYGGQQAATGAYPDHLGRAV